MLQAARGDAGHARLPSEADAAAGCSGAAAGEPLSSGDAVLLRRAVAAAGLAGAAKTVGRVLRECSVVAAMHPDQARRPGGGFEPQAAVRAPGGASGGPWRGHPALPASRHMHETTSRQPVLAGPNLGVWHH